MENAWMIRNDGKAVPVDFHVYTLPDDVEQAVEVGEWLLQYSQHAEVGKLVQEFLAEWEILLEQDVLETDIPKEAVSHFINLLKAELNQEFLRARYGGMYDSVPESREIVFRISSIGFDWYQIIADFVKKAPFPIETITIVRDEESTGVVDGFYKTCDGKQRYRQLPIEEFYAEMEDTGLEKKHLYYNQECTTPEFIWFYKILADGGAIQKIKEIPANSHRKEQWVKLLARRENKLCLT